MDFGLRKLSVTSAEGLRACPIQTVRPFALMITPVYVNMKLNEKFVMVKKPLDFFTDEELARLKPFGSLFLPEEDAVSLKFRKAAIEIKKLLQWEGGEAGKARYAYDELPPASFEISDAVIRLMASLWEPGPEIDLFYVAVFVNELCDPIAGDALKSYRDQDFELYEKAVICSSWAVFLALHLGHTDLAFLSRLRARVMKEVIEGKSGASFDRDLGELVRAAQESLGDKVLAAPGKKIHAQDLIGRFGRTSEKLSSRIQRVERLAHA